MPHLAALRCRERPVGEAAANVDQRVPARAPACATSLSRRSAISRLTCLRRSATHSRSLRLRSTSCAGCRNAHVWVPRAGVGASRVRGELARGRIEERDTRFPERLCRVLKPAWIGSRSAEGDECRLGFSDPGIELLDLVLGPLDGNTSEPVSLSRAASVSQTEDRSHCSELSARGGQLGLYHRPLAVSRPSSSAFAAQSPRPSNRTLTLADRLRKLLAQRVEVRALLESTTISKTARTAPSSTTRLSPATAQARRP